MTLATNRTVPLSTWLEALGKNGMDPKTLASYRRSVEHFIAWNRRAYGTDFIPSAIIQRNQLFSI